jgi:predicted transcriptional regulator
LFSYSDEKLKGNLKMNVTKSSKLLSALRKGEELTAAQISQRFGIKNPTATVSDLRYSGFAIYANQHKDTKGRQTTKYRLGTPSREVVAAGYKALAMGLV